MKKILLLLILLSLYSCKTSEKIDCDAYGNNKETIQKNCQES
jgi:hypothetical protein